MVLTQRLIKRGAQYYLENQDGVLEAITTDIAEKLIEAGTDVVDALTPAFTLLIESLGSAFIKGLQSGYNYAREQIRGKEDDAVTGIVVTAVTLGSLVYIFRTLRVKGD
jgi:hypothetical protein